MDIGTRLGPYEILAPLGAGGMGEVYRGVDTRLDREVAIKIVGSRHGTSERAAERFEREARTISRLSHPNICALFDVGASAGVSYIVMEYITGHSLAERLREGPLPLRQALQYGAQIADGIAAAHRHGIVHRDLKPGNVMLTATGVKVLDFGLAKYVEQEPLENVSAPTAQRPLTEAGELVGTLHYMAPEQLDGRPADARTDIFALGLILYEMITGRRLFAAENRSSVIASILQNDRPSLRAVEPSIPRELERAVQRCLAKDPDERWQDARDLAAELRWIAAEASSPAAESGHNQPQSRERGRWITIAVAAAVILAVAITAMLLMRRRDEGPSAAARFHVNVPPGVVIYPFSGPPAISPDGRYLAFFALTEGRYLLWLRPLESVEAKPVMGTDRGSSVFWSPDSRTMGFFADGKLKTVGIDGGAPRTICDASPTGSGAWNEDGVIVFGSWEGALQSVSLADGRPRPLTKLDAARGDVSHAFPSFLPDGKHFLYFVRNTRPEASAVYVRSLDGGVTKPVLNAVSNAIYAPPGFLLYAVDGRVMAAPFNVDDMSVGEGRVIAENAGGFAGSWMISASRTGVLVYVTRATIHTELAWIGRDGQESSTIAIDGDPVNIELSPAGDLVLIESVGQTAAIRVHELRRGVTSAVSLNAWVWSPVWSADAEEIVYAELAGANARIGIAAADGSGAPRTLVEAPGLLFPTDAASGAIVYIRVQPVTGNDVWVLPSAAGSTGRALLASPADEVQAQLSPDERWIAYASNESGRLEVYVRGHPHSDRRTMISRNGGSQPRWARDGRELFYVSAQDELIAVPLIFGERIEPQTPRTLFRFAGRRYFTRFDYDVAPAGDRFLVNRRVAASGPDVIAVTNWSRLLE